MGSSSKDDSASDGGDTSSGGDPLVGKDDSRASLFYEGEKVLAYHGPRLYEAKIQKAELRNKEWRYYVHYLGWNKKLRERYKKEQCFMRIQKSLLWLGHLANSWDEWVGVDRLMKHTEENVTKQQALGKKPGVDKNFKSGRSSQAKPKSSIDVKVEKEDLRSNSGKGKKRKSDPGVEKDAISFEKVVKIQIPSILRKQLIDDWDFVTEKDKLVKLPRTPCVDDILTKYLEYRSKKDGMMTDSTGEILKGIRCYFDKALPTMLLYKKERQQYHELISGNVSPSTIYGAEHLLRLFVKLPELLAYVNIEEETLTTLQQKLHDFLKFLQKHQGAFFLSAYDGTKTSEEKGKGKDD